jgi:hypothetical protein
MIEDSHEDELGDELMNIAESITTKFGGLGVTDVVIITNLSSVSWGVDRAACKRAGDIMMGAI